MTSSDAAVVAAIKKAREFEAQDMEYAADLLSDLKDENQTIITQWFRKIRTETILSVWNGETK